MQFNNHPLLPFLNLPSRSTEELPTPHTKPPKYHSLPHASPPFSPLDARPHSEITTFGLASTSSPPRPKTAMRLPPSLLTSPRSGATAPPLKVELIAPPLKVELSKHTKEVTPEHGSPRMHKQHSLLQSTRVTRSTGDLGSLAPKSPSEILEAKLRFLESHIIHAFDVKYVIDLYQCYLQKDLAEKALQTLLSAVADPRYAPDSRDQILITIGNHYVSMPSRITRPLALRYFNNVSYFSRCRDAAYSQTVLTLQGELNIERSHLVDQVNVSVDILKQQLERLGDAKIAEECDFIKYVMSANRFFSQALTHAQPLFELACDICHTIGISEKDVPQLPDNSVAEIEKRQTVEIIQWWLEEVQEIIFRAGQRLEQAALQGEQS